MAEFYSKNFYEYLKEYIDYKRPEVVHDYVFCMVDEKPLTTDSIKSMFDRLKKSAKIRFLSEEKWIPILCIINLPPSRWKLCMKEMAK